MSLAGIGCAYSKADKTIVIVETLICPLQTLRLIIRSLLNK